MNKISGFGKELDTRSQNKSTDNFTDAQNDVLKHQVGNLLVSASAGSGKTRVLIEKIVRLIMSGQVKLKDLLVVTFTNSASLELKERLSTSLLESKNVKLIAELDSLSTSDILTFDAFCIKVLREFGYTIGFSDNFAVADETLSGFFKNQALDNIFAKHNKDLDAKFVNFVSQFFENRNERDARNGIVKLYNFLKSKSADVSYVSKLDKFYELENANPAIKYANKYVLDLRDYAIGQFAHLKLESEIAGDEKLAKKIEEAIRIVSNINGDFLKDFSYLCGGFVLPQAKKDTKNDDATILQLKSQYAMVKNVLKDGLEKVIPAEAGKLSMHQMKNDLAKTKSSLEYIFEIVEEFDMEYSLIKASHKVLDFNDIEKLAYKILQNEKIAETIKNRYTWIFIDEYQDTSDLQEKIVAKITTGENLFMVGDLKQSIYRFRQAEPQIFINKYNQYKNMTTSNCTENTLIELKTNFRSENSILQFNNFVFDKIYKQSIDDFEYKGSADLEYGGSAKRSSDSPQVSVLILDEENNDDDPEDISAGSSLLDVEKEEGAEQNTIFEGVYSVKNSPLSFGKYKSIEKQAVLLAGKIKEMLGKPCYDAKAKMLRAIDFKDIAVLSRAKVGVVLEVRKILKEANIPVSAEFAENIFDCYDMKILLGVLSAIDNQNNDIPLLTALVNIGGLSFDELAQIKNKYKERKFFYNACYDYINEQNDTISQKLQSCFNKLEYYRNKSNYVDILELVDLIIENEQWELYFAANDYAEEFKSHMQTFSSSVQSIKDYDLCEFVNYVNTFLVNVEQNCVINDGENAVTLTTIHRSKGLEYPVVFLIGTEKGFSKNSTTEKILMDNDWGISMSSFDTELHTSYENIIKKIFKLKIADEERKEQKRLLYVALTRAKNYLFIIGSRKKEKLKSFETDFDIAQANNFLDWIVGAVDADDLADLVKNGQKEIALAQNEKFQAEIVTLSELNMELGNLDDKTLPEQLVLDKKEFVDTLSHKFYHSIIAKKSTVTQIMQEEDHYNISNFAYNKSDVDGEEDFLAVGTAYHKFMELINFCSSEGEVIDQIEKLKECGKLTAQDIEMVDITKIVSAVLKINELIENGDIVSKEKQFLSYFSASDIAKTNDNSKVLIQGVADLIIEKPNEIVLIDYKTSRLKDDAEFIERYKTQLDLYAKSLESFYKKRVSKKMIYSFWLNKLITI